MFQYYNGKSTLAEADPVSVTAGQASPNIDAALQPNIGSIAGKVTDAAAKTPVQGITVSLYRSNGSYYTGTSTDSQGEYSFSGVEVGEYKVQFSVPYYEQPVNYAVRVL